MDHFNLNELIPADLNSSRYSGSLTTRLFSEDVAWVELAQPLLMSEDPVNAFSSLFPDGDAREIQPLNGRVILTDVPGFISAVPEPEACALLLAGLGLIACVARRSNKQTPGEVARALTLTTQAARLLSKSLISLDHGRIKGAPFGYSD